MSWPNGVCNHSGAKRKIMLLRTLRSLGIVKGAFFMKELIPGVYVVLEQPR